ncbi:hypothetical protein [Bacillus thuringiensis]|nr:hypothetical protein [Bacillus thuringiensis]
MFGIQKLWHYDDQMKLEAMKTELDMLKIEIENQETDLLSLQNDSDQQVTDDELYTLYKTNIDTYNQKVNEANDLAKEIGSTWILVPIPGKK